MTWGGSKALADKAMQFLTHARSCATLEELNAEFTDVVQAFGFKNAVYIRLSHLGEPVAPRRIFGADMPEWTERYMQKNYARIDPGIPMAFRSASAFTWRECEGSRPDAEVRNLFGECREIWDAEALITPVRGPCGEFAIVNLLADRAVTLSPAERGTLQALCSLYASVGQAFIQELAPPPEEIRPLARRELQCVFWMSWGKTDGEIATILDLSPNTVRHYLREAMKKLGVCNRMQLVLRAFALGLLRPDI